MKLSELLEVWRVTHTHTAHTHTRTHTHTHTTENYADTPLRQHRRISGHPTAQDRDSTETARAKASYTCAERGGGRRRCSSLVRIPGKPPASPPPFTALYKASAHNAGDLGSIPGSGRCHGEGNGNPLQCSCLENSIDGGVWWATGHGVAKSQTRLTAFTHFTLCNDFISG